MSILHLIPLGNPNRDLGQRHRDEDPIQNDVDVTAHESVFRVPEMPLRERLKMQMGEKAKV
eukprot:1041436-Amorphochlora_amoeboformis.AAC.1